jgi:hypothetical protein
MVIEQKSGCLYRHTPFVYLVLVIGDDPHRLSFWQLMVDCIKKRLSKWKIINLSLSVLLVLLKYVLSLISIYYLFFFKDSSSIISFIESIF